MKTGNIALLVLASLAVLATISLTVANIYLGDLNQDEGWYLYAARLTAEGQMPYRDFAFTQGPTLPLIYAVFNPLVESYGLLAGRWVTAIMGMAAAAAGALLAMRLAPERLRHAAGLLAFILIGINVYQSYFCAVVKTYALASLLLTLGFLALAEGLLRRRAWLMPVAGACMTLAAGARTSAGAALPIVALLLLILRRHQLRTAWLLFAGGALLAAILLFVPFIMQAPDAFLFCAVKFHTMREAGSGMAQLTYKAGFISRLIQAYFVAATLLLVLIFMRFPRSGRTPTDNDVPADPARSCLSKCIWLTVLAASLVHLLAPFPYDDYQVFLFPLFAAAIAAMAIRQLGKIAQTRLIALILALTVCAAISSPINQDWFIRGRDRIWWRIKEETPLQKLRQTAQIIRSATKPGDYLLTQDTYLAVETGLRLPPGLEMGQFCYFPAVTDEEAARRHVLNRNGFEQLLRTTTAPVAALSGYAFAISAPEIKPSAAEETSAFLEIMQTRYAPWQQIHHFGQANTTLELRLLTEK